MPTANIGLIGLAVMGQNLVLNMERNGYTVAVYNRTTATMEEFIHEHPGKKLVPTPTLEAFVLVPISPHTLSARPIAVNSHSTVEVIVADDARAHFDGQRHFDLQINDKVVVRRAAKTVRLLHPFGHNYYDTLRQKLHWGEKL